MENWVFGTDDYIGEIDLSQRLSGCTFGGISVPCIYSHARWELVEFLYLVFTRMPGDS